MARSLNSVQLIGNLTRDPELRYTPSGTPVCTIGMATNRSWTTDTGEKKEEVEYHRIIAWSKLAELCSQLLAKGTKVYVHGRLTTRNWTGQDGVQKSTTEIIIDDMIVLSGIKPREVAEVAAVVNPDSIGVKSVPAADNPKHAEPEAAGKQDLPAGRQDVSPEDIPF